MLAIKRRFRDLLLFGLVGAVLIAPWMLRNAKLGAGLGQSQNILMQRNVYDMDSGTMTLSEMVARTLANVKIYALSVIPATTFYFLSSGQQSTGTGILFAALALLPALFGFFHRIRTRLSITHIYFVLYFLTILPWHE